MGWTGHSEPSKPGDNICEWCDAKATKVYELPRRSRKKDVGSGTYLYTCPLHHQQAEQIGGIHRPVARSTHDDRKDSW